MSWTTDTSVVVVPLLSSTVKGENANLGVVKAASLGDFEKWVQREYRMRMGTSLVWNRSSNVGIRVQEQHMDG